MQDDRFYDQEEDDEEVETEEGSVDQETGSTVGSPLDVDANGQEPDEDLQSVASPSNPDPQQCPNSQPQVSDVMSLSCDRQDNDEVPPDQPNHSSAANTASKYNILNQFTEVMLADMRQIKDSIVLMRLRRDITDLVVKAVEEDVHRRCVRAQSRTSLAEAAQYQSSSTPQQQQQQQSSSQPSLSWRQRYLKRRSTGSENVGRMQRWEEMKRSRKTSRSQSLQPVQQSEAVEGMNESTSQALIQPSEIKTETEQPMVKIEEDTPPMV